MLRLLLLSDVNSSHTQKWARSLSYAKFEVAIFSLSKCKESGNELPVDVKIFSCGIDPLKISKRRSILFKLGYLSYVNKLNLIIKKYRPDILHAHYASSYGFLGALCGFSPFIISTWGSDVFSFPVHFINRLILKYSLKRADKILSTSKVMAERVYSLVSKQALVTPFGIDVDVFKPKKVKSLFNQDVIVIGTVKSLEKEYAIHDQIYAFKLLRDKHKDENIKLLIVGEGSLANDLKSLTDSLDLKNEVYFTGFVEHKNIVDYHNMIDIFVNVSIYESFGVSVLEAMACETPVIVSDIGGLPDIINDGKTGYIVPQGNIQKISDAMDTLLSDKVLRKEIGKRARKEVLDHYNWEASIETMTDVYKEFL